MMVEAPMEEDRRPESSTKANTSINRSDEDLTAAGYCWAACGESRTAHGHRAATRSPHLCPRNGHKQDDQNRYPRAATHERNYSSAWIFDCQIAVTAIGNRKVCGLRS